MIERDVAPRRPRRWTTGTRGLVLRATVSIAVLALLLTLLSPGRMLDALRRVPAITWLAVIAAFLAGHAASATKWRLLVVAAGARLQPLAALRAHGAGLFANLCLPSIVGGDLIRAGLAARGSGRLEAVAIASLADRAIDTAALVGIAGLAAVLLPGRAPERTALVLATAGILLVTGVAASLVLVKAVPTHRWTPRLRPVAARLREAIDALWAAPARAATALVVSVAVQGSFVGLNIVLATSMGIRIDPIAWMLAWPLAKLVVLIPVSLGGIGLREAALAAFLAPFGVDATLAVGQSLAWEAVLVTAGLLAGALSLALGGSFSLRAQPVRGHS